jgi:hypothetical protein
VAALADELDRLAGRWAMWWPGADAPAMAANERSPEPDRAWALRLHRIADALIWPRVAAACRG